MSQAAIAREPGSTTLGDVGVGTGNKVSNAVPPVAVAAVGWAMFALVVLNAVAYMVKAADPLVISDGWFYLGAFVKKAAQGTLSVGDFFAKRMATDHSLPLHKLLLLANYRYLKLDFSIDAYVGVVFAVATLLLIRHVMRRSIGDALYTVTAQAGFIAICAIYLSLNASSIYEWPLLTMGFSLLFFFFVFFVCSWHACVHGKYVALVLSVAAALVFADGSGIIAALAAIMALGIGALRGWQRRNAFVAIGLVAACVVVYKVAYLLLAPPYAGAPMGGMTLALIMQPGFVMHVLASAQQALSASIMHPSQTLLIFGRAAVSVDYFLAIALGLAHVWFWWQAFRGRPSVAAHVAVCTMLLFYGFCAGVFLARAATYGADAFGQPRYVMFYQLNLIALLLMAVDTYGLSQANGRARRGVGAMVAAMSFMLVLVQLPLIQNAWKREPYERRYVEQEAIQMQALALDPSVAPKGCLPQLVVCGLPVEQRQELMALLKTQHLNLFSVEFRQRHGFP